MAQVDTLVSRYVRLLVFQYQLPKAQAVAAIVARVLMMDGLALAVRTAYRISTAVGVQLDVIGKYVGLSRNIGVPTSLPFFGFVRYSGSGNNNNGFRSYNNNLNSSGVFYRYGYSGTRATALSDTSYAFMIALQIILNSSDGTLYSIQKFLAALLPGAVTVVDNHDMTLTYTITGVLPVDATVLAQFLPKPMGVGIIIKTNDFLVSDTGDNLSITGGADKLVTTN